MLEWEKVMFKEETARNAAEKSMKRLGDLTTEVKEE